MLVNCGGGEATPGNTDGQPAGNGSAGSPATPGVAGSAVSAAGSVSVGGLPGAGGSSTAGSGGHAGGSGGRGGGSSTGGSSGGGAAGSSSGTSSGTSGATSAGSSGAGGTGATAPSCEFVPVNPNATRQARNLLCYIYSQQGSHVLSGQQETSWSNPQGDIDWYTTNGMKAPAILGGDYLYPNGTSTRAIAYWKAGGIPLIRYHMGAPPLEDTYENSKGSANIDNVLKAGTAESTSFNSKLDYVATELGKLQAEGVAVLWAPFHEVQQNGWFWWAKGTGAQFVALWKYEFDYLTKTKGLNNLVWLMPFSGTPSAAYYPGKQYLDLSGPDTYDENQPFGDLFSRSQGVIGSTMPLPLHETGRIPTPSQMFPSTAPWVLFNVWAGYQSDGMHNTLDNIKSVYGDAHVVTRDELPNLN